MVHSHQPLSLTERARGALAGLAAGDAVGTTVEFKPRGTFPPVTDMTGGGPFNLPKGAWTDDTSMALCLATSLVACSGFQPEDQMERYVRWMQEGYLSSIGRCFDIGNATATALRAYLQTDEPYSGSTDPYSAGNGSIMRLAPVPIFYYPHLDQVEKYSRASSRTTHAAPECVDACAVFGILLARALDGQDKAAILEPDLAPLSHAGLAPRIQAIVAGSYRTKTAEEIRGSGYVVDSLEAALWAFWHTSTFRDAILSAVNLGDDADTTAAVTGQIAGAHYGYDAIPEDWREALVMHDKIVELADALVNTPA